MSDLSKHVEDAALEAEEQGFEVIYATANTLLLDLDTPEDIKLFEKQFEILHKEWNAVLTDGWTSKSGEGQHIIITLPETWSLEMRIAAQAALGSDRKRELLALKRAYKGVTNPIMLFKPPTDRSK
jgi:hypothetical protein